MRIRLLPALIFVGALLVSVRVGHLVSGIGHSGGPALGVAETRAETGQSKAADSKAEAPADSKKSKPGDASGLKAEAELNKAESKGAENPGAKTESGDKAEGDKAGSDKAGADAPPGLKDPNLFTASEIQTLQRLAERRDALDARERALDEREKVLKAVEGRIEGQLAALKESQTRVQRLLKAYDEQEAEKLRSLVKIYETMKPAEAARIFEKLDAKVLIEVLQSMKAAKSAPIFAAMNPVLAREMTQALAERSQLPRDGDKADKDGTKSAAAGRRSD
ncbi:MAG: hypothetical protein U1E97_06760 [Alphaproteobacteria bacterium]